MRQQSKPFTVETRKRKRRAGEQRGLDLPGIQSGMASLRSMAAEVGLNMAADDGDTRRPESRPRNSASSGTPMLLKPSPTPEPPLNVNRVLPDLTSGSQWETPEEEHQSTASKPRKRQPTKDRRLGESRRPQKRGNRPSAQRESSVIRKPVKDIRTSASAVIERPLQAPEIPPGSVDRNIRSKPHGRKPRQELSARELRRAIARGAIRAVGKGSRSGWRR
jgi:hypothetical protein